MERFELPGAQACIGCQGLTFRNREDQLCPRCAYQAEHLIEQIELDLLNRDLSLMTQFEAYYRQRELGQPAGEVDAPVFDRTPFGDPFPMNARTTTAGTGPAEDTADSGGEPAMLRLNGRNAALDVRPQPFGSFPPLWSEREAG